MRCWEPGAQNLEARPCLQGAPVHCKVNTDFCQREGGTRENCSGAEMDEQDLSGQRRGKGIPGREQKKQRPRGGRERGIFRELLLGWHGWHGKNSKRLGWREPSHSRTLKCVRVMHWGPPGSLSYRSVVGPPPRWRGQNRGQGGRERVGEQI